LLRAGQTQAAHGSTKRGWSIELSKDELERLFEEKAQFLKDEQ